MSRPALRQAVFYVVLAAILIAPLLGVAVPVLGDLPNHAARSHILGAAWRDADLRQFYDPRWQLTPYLGFDAPMALLAPVLGLFPALRLYVACALLGPMAAAACLHRAIYGRAGYTPALAALLAYNLDIGFGFLPYVVPACGAVMLAALWIRAAAWRPVPRLLVFLPLSLGLYFAHSLAFAVYALLIAGLEFGRAWQRGAAAWRVTAQCWGIAASQAVAPLIAARLLHTAATFGTVYETRWGTLPDRIGALLSPLYFPAAPQILLPATLVFLVAGLLAAGRPRYGAPGGAALALATAGAIAAPHMLLNIWGTDLRLPLVAAMTAIGAAAAPPMPRALRAGLLAGLLGLAAWHSAAAYAVLHRLDIQAARLRELLAALPRGQRVLLVDAPLDAPARPAPRAVMQHMAMLAVIDRDAFLPTIFAGTLPLRLQERVADAASQGVPPIGFDKLAEGFRAPPPPGQPPPYKDGGVMYWLGWTQKFDYVLVMNFAAPVPELPPVLHRVAGNEVGVLYRILPPAAAR